MNGQQHNLLKAITQMHHRKPKPSVPSLLNSSLLRCACLILLMIFIINPQKLRAQRTDTVAASSKVSIQISGGKSDPKVFTTLKTGLEKQLNTIKACYKNRILAGSTTQGEFQFQWMIENQEKSKLVIENNSLNDITLTQCIKKALGEIHFSKCKAGNISPRVTIDFDSNLSKKQKVSNLRHFSERLGSIDIKTTDENLPFTQSRFTSGLMLKVFGSSAENKDEVWRLHQRIEQISSKFEDCLKPEAHKNPSMREEIPIAFSIENKIFTARLKTTNPTKNRIHKCIFRNLKKTKTHDIKDFSGEIKILLNHKAAINLQ